MLNALILKCYLVSLYMLSLFVNIFTKFIFLFAPFFVISMFLALTRGDSKEDKQSIIRRAVTAAGLLSVILFFLGPFLFSAIGITLDSFRIGAGGLLFLTAVSLVNNGTRGHATALPKEERDDVAVVPLAMPVIVGPATIGTIMVYGAELKTVAEMATGLFAVLCALVLLAISLVLSGRIERILGKTGLNVLSKVSGLILSAMAAEIFFTGVLSFVTRFQTVG